MPHLGAFYWLTLIPAAMEAPRVESKLREYNFYGLSSDDPRGAAGPLSAV
jgi:hypothetical protein